MPTKSSVDNRARVRVDHHLYLKDGSYQVIVRDPAGEQHVTGLGPMGLSQAKVRRDEIVGEVRSGKAIRTSNDKVFAVALDWLATQRSLRDAGLLRPTTYNGYEVGIRCHVLPFFTGRSIGGVVTQDIAKWHQWVIVGGERDIVWYDEEGAVKKTERRTVQAQSQWSVRTSFKALSLLFGYAYNQGLIPVNPVTMLDKRDKPKPGRPKVIYLDREEIDALLSAARPEDRLTITMATFLGVRLGELRGLRWMDIDTKTGVAYVRGQCDDEGTWLEIPKTLAGNREIAIPDFLTDMLRKHKLASSHCEPTDFVLASSRGTAMNGRNFNRRRLKPAAEAIGRTDVTFHVLRHTYASILIFQGNDVTYVASQLGHEKPSVTLDIYSHLFGRTRNAEHHRNSLDKEFGEMFKDDEPKGTLVALKAP